MNESIALNNPMEMSERLKTEQFLELKSTVEHSPNASVFSKTTATSDVITFKKLIIKSKMNRE